MYKLYGDGIHDDTNAIQELIDSGVREVVLPEPKVRYMISKPLELPSYFRLVLPRFAEIKLIKNSNCVMLKNKTAVNSGEDISKISFFDFINEFSPDAPCSNIEVSGRIWNFNNLEQAPNPLFESEDEIPTYSGIAFLFYNVKNLRLTSLTVKDPVTYAIIFDTVSYFTVDNIDFDFNYGNPLATNMDGVHLNGNCHFGYINNLKGACYDDLVAMNADEGSDGPITNIEVDGIFAEDCHSAVRMLTVKNPLKNINIKNVYGTYFQYCIGLTKYYEGEPLGYFDAITLENIYASKAVRIPVYNKPPESYVYPFIFIEGDSNIRTLKISNLHRDEYITPVETVYVGSGTTVNNLILDNITTENNTDSEDMPLLVIEGTVKRLKASNILVNGEEVSESINRSI